MLQGISRKIILIIAIIILLFLSGILVWDYMTEGKLLLSTRVLRLLSDAEELREFILQYEFFAPLIHFLFQLLQVIIAPIPGNVTIFIGGSLFGAWYGLLINTLSVYLGSLVAFYLGRRFGKPLILRLVDEETYRKYNRFFEKKYLAVLFLFFLFFFLRCPLFIGRDFLHSSENLFVSPDNRAFSQYIYRNIDGLWLIGTFRPGMVYHCYPFYPVFNLNPCLWKKIEEWLYKRIVRTEVNEEIE